MALYLKEGMDCVVLAVGGGKVSGKAERLWVRIKGQSNKGDVVVRVYYRPPGQDDDTDELFFECAM